MILFELTLLWMVVVTILAMYFVTVKWLEFLKRFKRVEEKIDEH